jgi:hypothetical protein
MNKGFNMEVMHVTLFPFNEPENTRTTASATLNHFFVPLFQQQCHASTRTSSTSPTCRRRGGCRRTTSLWSSTTLRPRSLHGPRRVASTKRNDLSRLAFVAVHLHGLDIGVFHLCRYANTAFPKYQFTITPECVTHARCIGGGLTHDIVKGNEPS